MRNADILGIYAINMYIVHTIEYRANHEKVKNGINPSQSKVCKYYNDTTIAHPTGLKSGGKNLLKKAKEKVVVVFLTLRHKIYIHIIMIQCCSNGCKYTMLFISLSLSSFLSLLFFLSNSFSLFHYSNNPDFKSKSPWRLYRG